MLLKYHGIKDIYITSREWGWEESDHVRQRQGEKYIDVLN